MSEALGVSGQTSIGVASLNVLLDYTRSTHDRSHSEFIEPQDERVDSLCRTLGTLPVSLDVVMLQEVQTTDEFHGGHEITRRLGLSDGFWFNHNTSKRGGEHIGVCGNLVEWAEAIDIGFDKSAVVTEIAGIAFIGTHLRRTYNPAIKAFQMRSLLDQTAHYKKRVILGDGNGGPRSEARRIVRQAGGRSVYLMKNGKYPATWPTPNYRGIFLPHRYQQHVAGSLSIDMFEVIGFEEEEIGIVGTVDTKKADHYTLFGEIRLPLAA